MEFYIILYIKWFGGGWQRGEGSVLAHNQKMLTNMRTTRDMVNDMAENDVLKGGVFWKS